MGYLLEVHWDTAQVALESLPDDRIERLLQLHF